MLSCVLITTTWCYLSACLSLVALSALLTSEHIYISCTDVSLPDLDFSLSVRKAMLPRTLSSIDATLCTASASHVHALGPPLGPTCLPLGHTPSILASTNNVGDVHDAWVSILPRTRHRHLPISGLVWGVSHGTSLAMLRWIRYVPSSRVAIPIWQRYVRPFVIP